MATPDEIQLQKGTITPAQKEQTGSAKAVSLIDSLLTQPTLPQGTAISPQVQSVQSNELLSTPGVGVGATTVPVKPGVAIVSPVCSC